MDKRRHPRFIKRLATKFIINNESFTGISSDLSESGLFIRTSRGCSTNNPIDIKIFMPDNSVSLLKGIVRRTTRTPIPSMKNGMGIEIIEKDGIFIDFVKSIIGSRIFEDIGNTLPLDELILGGILYKEKAPSLWKEDARGFYIAKGALESLFEELMISGYSFSPSSEPFLHGGQSADIHISNSRIGYVGVMGPDIVEKLDLKKQKPEIVLFELNLDLLLSLTPDSIQYVSIPKFPAVERDIALTVDEALPSARIKEIINSYPSELIEEVSVFDYFKGGNIPQGKKSLAFNIIYRSKERTLTDEEIEVLHSSLVGYIAEKTGGELRK